MSRKSGIGGISALGGGENIKGILWNCWIRHRKTQEKFEKRRFGKRKEVLV